jgi:hypothetical protein
MKKIYLLMFTLLISSSFVYAGRGIESEPVVYQGQSIHVVLTEISSSYDTSVNVTYPNGTMKVFIPKASLVGRVTYLFTDTSLVGSYFFSSYDSSIGQWASGTYVDTLPQTQLLSSIGIIPTGAGIGVLNKTIEEDWMIDSPFLTTQLSNATCLVKQVGGSVVVSGITPTINSNKKMTFQTYINQSLYQQGNNYEVLCSFDITAFGTKARVVNASQYFYVSNEDAMKRAIEGIIWSQEKQYNLSLKILNSTNLTYINTKILLNRTQCMNTTINQLNASVTNIVNITQTNQNILNLIWSKVQSIWNWVSQNNQTLSKINQTIVSNNTFMIEQLKKDRISAIS